MHYSICGREMLYGRLAYKRKWEKEALKTPEYPSSSCVIKGRGRQWDVYCAHKIFPSGNKSLWRIAADRPADARRSTSSSRQNSGNWDAFLFFPLHQQASTNLWQGRCGAPSCNVYHDMIDQLLMSLHPNLGILSRKKSHNLTEHPHVLWKQRH